MRIILFVLKFTNFSHISQHLDMKAINIFNISINQGIHAQFIVNTITFEEGQKLDCCMDLENGCHLLNMPWVYDTPFSGDSDTTY